MWSGNNKKEARLKKTIKWTEPSHIIIATNVWYGDTILLVNTAGVGSPNDRIPFISSVFDMTGQQLSQKAMGAVLTCFTQLWHKAINIEVNFVVRVYEGSCNWYLTCNFYADSQEYCAILWNAFNSHKSEMNMFSLHIYYIFEKVLF